MKVAKMKDDGHTPTSENPMVIYKRARIVRSQRFGGSHCDLEELGYRIRKENPLPWLAIE
jgi:hypothetical protein